jgi:hypothetical protein
LGAAAPLAATVPAPAMRSACATKFLHETLAEAGKEADDPDDVLAARSRQVDARQGHEAARHDGVDERGEGDRDERLGGHRHIDQERRGSGGMDKIAKARQDADDRAGEGGDHQNDNLSERHPLHQIGERMRLLQRRAEGQQHRVRPVQQQDGDEDQKERREDAADDGLDRRPAECGGNEPAQSGRLIHGHEQRLAKLRDEHQIGPLGGEQVESHLEEHAVPVDDGPRHVAEQAGQIGDLRLNPVVETMLEPRLDPGPKRADERIKRVLVLKGIGGLVARLAGAREPARRTQRILVPGPGLLLQRHGARSLAGPGRGCRSRQPARALSSVSSGTRQSTPEASQSLHRASFRSSVPVPLEGQRLFLFGRLLTI